MIEKGDVLEAVNRHSSAGLTYYFVSDKNETFFDVDMLATSTLRHALEGAC